MKRILYVFLCFVVAQMYGQELPKIIPPSPNASAFHVYGNNQVNYYTGSANVQIPIFTIQEGDVSVPIYLKYTAGNGIKIEESASWVGLGWTLNTGGAVSRTIKGIADDDQHKIGLLKAGHFRHNWYLNWQVQDSIGQGNLDAQPDNFMYNYPGGSGSFFYSYDGTVNLKPKKNLNITHTIGLKQENFPNTNWTNHLMIKDFTIKDEYGKTYFFEDREVSYTETIGVQNNTKRSFANSWYISKIENLNKTKAINYHYTPYTYTTRTMQPVSEGIINLVYNDTHYIGKRLDSIVGSSGTTVEFIASTVDRKDMPQNKYLDKILVKDAAGKIIKSVQFTYKYMTPTGYVPVNSSIATNENTNRLILESVKECDGYNNCKNPHLFYYNPTVLPPKDSKSVDHWGYYNGKPNTSFAPEQYATYKNTASEPWQTVHFGSADRFSDAAYSKAGILEKIVYPTKGSTEFEYESHSAVDIRISNTFIPTNLTFGAHNQVETFDINLPSTANPRTKVIGNVVSNPTACDIKISIKNTSTNIITNFIFSQGGSSGGPGGPPGGGPETGPGGGSGPNSQFAHLPAGHYEAWFSYIGSYCNTGGDQPLVSLSWKNENISPNKPIGGVRIKSITDYSDTNIIASKRNFSYIGDDGNSSGRVGNAPRYYGVNYVNHPPGSSNWVPLGHKKFIKSFMPLAMTQGSYVGYNKVTITHQNETNGKEEVYYTGFDEFPITYRFIHPMTLQRVSLPVVDGRTIYPYPYVEQNQNDFLRGNLKNKKLFKKQGNTFTKILEQTNTYAKHYYFEVVGGPSSLPPPDMAGIAPVYGLLVSPNENIEVLYDVYSGYNLSKTSTSTEFFSTTDSVTSTSTSIYDKDAQDVIQYYIPTSTETTTSNGDVLKTETEFIFNKPIGARTSAENALFNKNALYQPLKTESFKNSTKLGSQYTHYNNTSWSSLILPDKIQTSKGTSPLEDRVVYHEYDSDGNPLIVSKKDGTKIYYVWGYNKTQPIAKIEGYTSFTSGQLSAVNEAVSYSDADNTQGTQTSENNLRTRLTTLRNAFSAPIQVTTFTYDPLIGVTSITDPRGQTVYYHYDTFNRLQYVKDKDGNIVQENQYHYKN